MNNSYRYEVTIYRFSGETNVSGYHNKGIAIEYAMARIDNGAAEAEVVDTATGEVVFGMFTFAIEAPVDTGTSCCICRTNPVPRDFNACDACEAEFSDVDARVIDWNDIQSLQDAWFHCQALVPQSWDAGEDGPHDLELLMRRIDARIDQLAELADATTVRVERTVAYTDWADRSDLLTQPSLFARFVRYFRRVHRDAWEV